MGRRGAGQLWFATRPAFRVMLVWFGTFAPAYVLLIPHRRWPASFALAFVVTCVLAAVGAFRPQRPALSALLAALLPPLVAMAVALGFFKILPADLPEVLAHERLGPDAPSSPIELRNALRSATLRGDARAVESLLRRGAHPDLRFHRRGPTPLALAASRGNERIVRLLLEAGADPSARGTQGTPALSLALSNGHEPIALLLLEAGAEPDTASQWPATARPAGHGPTPLWHAASTGAAAAANALLWRGASPDGTPPRFFPLVAAARHGHSRIASALLVAGASPNPPVSVEDHPVVWAVRENDPRLLQLLLEAVGTGLPKAVLEAARNLAVLEEKEKLAALLDERSPLEHTKMLRHTATDVHQ